MARPDARAPLSLRLALPGAIAASTVVLDLLSKAWAVERLAAGPPVMIVPEVLRLELGVNSGAAFGLLGGGPRLGPVVLGLLVLAYLLWLATRLPVRSRAAAAGLGLMLGGTLGNLHDRLWRTVDDGGLWGPGRRAGVVDFISVHRWPAFNLADAALVIGAAVLVLSLWRARARAPISAG
ncbi:MAG: signal peptidase II [Myxococcales bacterium]|nr:signal peptidase II [Myxococcales bacterium]MCB9718952.1 signal peptidase II [Myxococcales bacterium]